MIIWCRGRNRIMPYNYWYQWFLIKNVNISTHISTHFYSEINLMPVMLFELWLVSCRSIYPRRLPLVFI